MTESSIQRTLDAVWRMESAKIIAKLARMLRNVGLAEDLAQDAFVTALEQWPKGGVPDNSGAWLMATAKNRALDELRRRKLAERNQQAIAIETPLSGQGPPAPDHSIDDDIGDDLLRLIFTACHPVLSTEARAALTLRGAAGNMKSTSVWIRQAMSFSITISRWKRSKRFGFFKTFFK